MEVHGQIRESDYVSAQFLHMRPRPFMAVLGVLLICLAMWPLFLDAPIFYIALLIFLVCFFALYVPWSAKRLFRKYKALSEQVTMELRDDGVFFKRATGEGLMPWSHISKWRKNKNLVLLYPTDNVFIMVPDHFFPSNKEFTDFMSMLEKQVGKAT